MTNAALLGSYGDVGGSPLVFRNKIINGDMSIFQRGVAATAISTYSVDRWRFAKVNGASESVSQNTDAPTGFYYSLRNTISVGDASIGATEYSSFQHLIEGFNTTDLAWGTSSAKSVTLSFWVKATVSGQYTGNIGNGNATRLCPFNFTINAASTWEHQKITIPGCIDGTWNAGTNAASVVLQIYSALGSSFLGGTAGVWNSAGQYGSGTPVNGIASNGNIFAITGVQLESGTCATPFEVLPIQTTLNLCYRYYQYLDFTLSSVACSVYDGVSPFKAGTRLQFLTPMRTAPGVTVANVTWYLISTPAWTSGTALSITNINTAGAELVVQGTGSATNYQCVLFRYTAAAAAEL